MEKPYIAAVNGAAVGAGMDMASMCDIRFAAESARFGMTYVRMGIIPGDGGAYYLPRIVGLANALDLIWTGRIFGAEEALAIPEADVVITNPTHYAVALQYNDMSMEAPRLLAKGADAVAARIREVAEANDIPIVANPPLAQALFTSVEIDAEVPFEHYKAVAEVIGYVWRLKGKRPDRPARA